MVHLGSFGLFQTVSGQREWSRAEDERKWERSILVFFKKSGKKIAEKLQFAPKMISLQEFEKLNPLIPSNSQMCLER